MRDQTSELVTYSSEGERRGTFTRLCHPENPGSLDRWVVWSPFAYRKDCTYLPDDEWIREDELSDWIQVAIDSRAVVLPAEQIGKWAPFLMMRNFRVLPMNFDEATDLDVTILERSLTQLWASLKSSSSNGQVQSEVTAGTFDTGELAELCVRLSNHYQRHRDGSTWESLLATALQSIGAGLAVVPLSGQAFWLPEKPLENITRSAVELSVVSSEISRNASMILRNGVDPTFVSGTRTTAEVEVVLTYMADLMIPEINRENRKLIKNFSQILHSNEFVNYLFDLLEKRECGLAIVPIRGRFIWSPV